MTMELILSSMPIAVGPFAVDAWVFGEHQKFAAKLRCESLGEKEKKRPCVGS